MKAKHLTTAAAIAAGVGIAALTGTTGIASAPPLDPRHVRTANLIRLCRTVFQPKNAGRMGASGRAVP